MSWKATAWAKETTGHRSIGEKFVLMVLADYADPETMEAWPSQVVLAKHCMMTQRNIIYCLNGLEARGFIQRLRKGNQHHPSRYLLLTTASIGEGEISASEMISLAGESETGGMVKVKPETSEGEIPVGTNRHEPSLEPPYIYCDAVKVLKTIPGYSPQNGTIDQLIAYLTKKGISPEHAEETARGSGCFVVGAWPHYSGNPMGTLFTKGR